MNYEVNEILETIRMSALENLDIRTVTLGLNLLDCVSDSITTMSAGIREKILRRAEGIVPAADRVASRYGIRIVNKRISLTPLSLVIARRCGPDDYIRIASSIDDAAKQVGVDFVGGYSALVHKGITPPENGFSR